MQPKTLSFSDNKPLNFNKNTNRKYFGSTQTAETQDMKKSSILFTSHHKQEPTPKLQQSKFFKSSGFSKGISTNQPLDTQSSAKIKNQMMYSSLIVQKSDQSDQISNLMHNNPKQLNDKAEESKKRLIDISQRKNSKEELLNKYLKPSSINNTQVSSPFTKNRKTNYYNQQNHNTGKIAGFLKPVKKQVEISQHTHLSFQTPSSNQVNSPNISQAHKKSNVFFTPNAKNEHKSHHQSNIMRQEQRKIKKQDFQIGKKLGNGMFGEVFLVRHKGLGFVCAMKIMKKQMVKTQKVQDQVVREIKIQFFLQRQNIVNLYGFFSDDDYVYLLQQLCMDGHLFSMLKTKQRFQDDEAADIILQICKGLQYVHRERIIHRDIKPQNIIMHQGVAKICDFGWSVYRGDGLRGTYCGTPLYTPPQLLRGQLYDQKFDIWAIGILAYQLIVGRFPFKIFCQDDIKRILTDEIKFPFSVQVSPDAKNFIMSIIRKDPTQRIDIDEIINHPFLRNNSLKPFELDFKL